jgi:hypothetical protein
MNFISIFNIKYILFLTGITIFNLMWIVTYPLFLYYRFGDDGRGRPHVSLYIECNHVINDKSLLPSS